MHGVGGVSAWDTAQLCPAALLPSSHQAMQGAQQRRKGFLLLFSMPPECPPWAQATALLILTQTALGPH